MEKCDEVGVGGTRNSVHIFIVIYFQPALEAQTITMHLNFMSPATSVFYSMSRAHRQKFFIYIQKPVTLMARSNNKHGFKTLRLLFRSRHHFIIKAKGARGWEFSAPLRPKNSGFPRLSSSIF
jgi:hypothetical protein